MSSMTCIQPSMQQIMKKNSSDDIIEEVHLNETFNINFQSSKKIIDQVNLSQIASSTTNVDITNTLNSQSFISK